MTRQEKQKHELMMTWTSTNDLRWLLHQLSMHHSTSSYEDVCIGFWCCVMETKASTNSD